MQRHRSVLFLLGAVLLLGFIPEAQPATGLKWIDQNTNLTFYGDLRLRYEADWDSQDASGSEHDDRHRGRLRARAGLDYEFSEQWSAGGRIRTGDSRSQQSPHLTFVTDDGERDELDFVVDRYFVQFEDGRFSGWAGRNLTPFWRQNELFWDEDVTPTGLAGVYDGSVSRGDLTAVAGAFYLPDGGYELNGQMIAGQVQYSLPVDRARVKAAAGVHYLHGESGANHLLNRNGERDYLIGVANVQWSLPVRTIPLSIGGDLFYNLLDYSAGAALPYPAEDGDQTLGFVLSVQYGGLKERHDWLVAYAYAHIETFAVNASYAQDDWVRFGTGSQTDSSDFEGHEVRLGYALSSAVNLLARLYVVEAITTSQDGNRFRLDLNWAF